MNTKRCDVMKMMFLFEISGPKSILFQSKLRKKFLLKKFYNLGTHPYNPIQITIPPANNEFSQ